MPIPCEGDPVRFDSWTTGSRVLAFSDYFRITLLFTSVGFHNSFSDSLTG